MTPEFEARVQKAIDDGILPGVVLLARDKSGKINYTRALGPATLDPAKFLPSGSPPPLTPSHLFVLASMTKLLTVLAVLTLIDRDLLTLDTDVTSYLPSLAAQPILTGFTTPSSENGENEEAKPITTPRNRPILLRHLLTHTAGACYPIFSPLLQRHAELTNAVSAPVKNTVSARFNYPLLFEPGTSWVYGSGIDWAGKVVESVTGQKLDEYIFEKVLQPAGIESKGEVTFYPDRDGTRDRVVGMSARDKETGKVKYYDLAGSGILGRLGGVPGQDGDAFGGEGGFASLEEYMKVLYSILVDDGKILSSKTTQVLFEPLLEEDGEAKKALLESMRSGWMTGWMPEGEEYNHSVAGVVVTGDGHAHRRRGFLQWAGAYNLSWFIDRTAGVCGILGTNIIPPNDRLVEPFMKEFEEEIYAML